MNNLIDLFREVKECDYKGEHYSVRDNGAVMRHPKKHNHLRPLDNLWTFGKKNENNGYMFIGGVRVHQIVATAFHGIPEDKNMVVDHKDTNRCNNRPENLHWITRLENVLNNPITRAKIEFICGSIEKFIEDPSILRFYENENPNFHWMRSVTLEEAKISYDRWMSWANNPTKHIVKEKSNIDDWLYQQPDQNRTEYLMKNWKAESRSKNKKELMNSEFDIMEDNYYSNLKTSLTENALQLNWNIPSEFPNTPVSISSTPLEDYMRNLREGKIFCKNNLYQSMVNKYALNKDRSALIVLTKSSGIKKYALAKVIYKDGNFIHCSERFFFHEEGGLKYFTLAIGERWEGGDVFDDFC